MLAFGAGDSGSNPLGAIGYYNVKWIRLYRDVLMVSPRASDAKEAILQASAEGCRLPRRPGFPPVVGATWERVFLDRRRLVAPTPRVLPRDEDDSDGLARSGREGPTG